MMGTKTREQQLKDKQMREQQTNPQKQVQGLNQSGNNNIFQGYESHPQQFGYPMSQHQQPQRQQYPPTGQHQPIIGQQQPTVGKSYPQFDAIDMDYMNGFSGRYPDTIHMHPQIQNNLVYVIAGLVVIENLQKKHEQTFLRGHDMDVSALSISKTGRMIASGQVGTRQTKIPEAPVILWDFQTRKPLQVLRGLRECVTNISFSDDEKFLAATSSSNQLIIWSCQDFSIVHAKVLEIAQGLITWCPTRKSSNKHSQYILITSQGSNIVVNLLEFDVGSMQYTLKQAPCQLPSTGLVRQYTKAVIDSMGDFLYVGTHAGEICIFSLSSQGGIFKAAVPISNNGVQNLRISGRCLFVANGDGKIKKLVGSDTKWALESEVQLEGRLTSLSVDPTGREIIVGSNFGKMYRLIAATLDCTIHCEGHLQSIVGLAVSHNQNDLFVTIDMEGFVLVWDMNDLQIITRCSPGSMNRVRGCSVCLDEDNTVVSGWKDGFLRAFQITNKPISPVKWELVNAHKGGVSSVYADKNYFISGGEDGLVRVWTKSARQLVTQIGVHTRDVTRVFPDLLKPNIIHSCSLDKTVHSYDLKTDRKVVLHQAKNGMIMDMTQLKDRETEIVTCGINTPILLWDIDMVEPTVAIDAPQRLNAIKISPDGKLLAAGSDSGELIIVSLKVDAVIGKLMGHSQGISKITWTNDQKQIITTSFDGSICVWNVYL